MNIKKLLGKRIQEIRKSKRMTQEQLSELIGIEPASLSNIENGKYYPTAENLDKILSVLNVKPGELFEFEHHATQDELLDEMYTAMKSNKELTILMYKFYNSVKF